MKEREEIRRNHIINKGFLTSELKSTGQYSDVRVLPMNTDTTRPKVKLVVSLNARKRRIWCERERRFTIGREDRLMVRCVSGRLEAGAQDNNPINRPPALCTEQSHN